MSARSFLDTNVLLYSDAADAPAKQRRALELLGQQRLARTGVVSLQVLQGARVAARCSSARTCSTAARSTACES